MGISGVLNVYASRCFLNLVAKSISSYHTNIILLGIAVLTVWPAFSAVRYLKSLFFSAQRCIWHFYFIASGLESS